MSSWTHATWYQLSKQTSIFTTRSNIKSHTGSRWRCSITATLVSKSCRYVEQRGLDWSLLVFTLMLFNIKKSLKKHNLSILKQHLVRSIAMVHWGPCADSFSAHMLLFHLFFFVVFQMITLCYCAISGRKPVAGSLQSDNLIWLKTANPALAQAFNLTLSLTQIPPLKSTS